MKFNEYLFYLCRMGSTNQSDVEKEVMKDLHNLGITQELLIAIEKKSFIHFLGVSPQYYVHK